jgi:DNA-binding response OmpR family regulator
MKVAFVPAPVYNVYLPPDAAYAQQTRHCGRRVPSIGNRMMFGWRTRRAGTAPASLLRAFTAVAVASRARCLVLDIRLPGMTGVDLYRQLRSSGNALPTIFITAHDDARMRGLLLGKADRLIAKPFLSETLIEAVKRCYRNSH